MGGEWKDGLPLARFAELASKYPTPFYVYNWAQVLGAVRTLERTFAAAPTYRNYFAVKANPNPNLLALLVAEGQGLDCSSVAELKLAELVGVGRPVGTGHVQPSNAEPGGISQADTVGGTQHGGSHKDRLADPSVDADGVPRLWYTSNNSTLAELERADAMGAVVNFDDLSLLEAWLRRHDAPPTRVGFRYNPGASRQGNVLIGAPAEAKYGMTRAQVERAAALVRGRADYVALHTMVVSNALETEELGATFAMMFELAAELEDKLDMVFSAINMGGGFGVPTEPGQPGVDAAALAERLHALCMERARTPARVRTHVVSECGRFVTGPAGTLVARLINRKDIHKRYLGLDSCMADLMRPALYKAYHHIRFVERGPPDGGADHPSLTYWAAGQPDTFDIVGSLCENNDKFAIDRALDVRTPDGTPACALHRGALALIFDSGAHGHAMGFNYNGKARCAEILVRGDTDALIRRRQTWEDLHSTVQYVCLDPPKDKAPAI